VPPISKYLSLFSWREACQSIGHTVTVREQWLLFRLLPSLFLLFGKGGRSSETEVSSSEREAERYGDELERTARSSGTEMSSSEPRGRVVWR
jgi:hypothetical protein